jgi:hypothetical protein
MRVLVKQRTSGHEESGRAKTALDGTVSQEGLLQRIQSAVSLEPFDRADACAVELHRKRQASRGRLAVHEYRAGAANTLFAHLIRSHVAQRVTKHVEKHVGRANPQSMVLAIDIEHYLHGHDYCPGTSQRSSARSTARLSVTAASRRLYFSE